jgi:plastocyanin
VTGYLGLVLRSVRVAVPVLSAVLLVAGCSGGPESEAGPANRPQPTTIGTPAPGADGVQSITVTGDDSMRFNPSIIKAKPGKLRITLHTIGGTPHDLEVRPAKINTGLVAKGQQKSIEVTLASGRYDFVCTFHVTQNMVGVIDVS